MDIVERLWLHAAKGKFMQAYFAKPDMREAAEEIERLRKVMAGMIRLAEFAGLGDRIIVHEARTALEQK